MTTTFLTTTIIASLAFATLDLLRKFLARDLVPSVVVFWLVAGQVLLFGSWVVLDPTPLPAGAYWGFASVSVGANFIANLLFLEALTRSPFSKTIPFLSLSPAFAALSGLLVIGEHLLPTQWLGILLVISGALAINVGIESGGVLGAFRALRQEVGSLMMVGTAACWGIAAPFDKLALREAPLRFHALVMAVGIVSMLFLMVAWRRRLATLRLSRRPALLLVAAVFACTIALSFQLSAYSEGLVGLVETIKRVIGMTAAVVLGRLLFAEPLTRAKIVGVLLMAIGVALIVL